MSIAYSANEGNGDRDPETIFYFHNLEIGLTGESLSFRNGA